ncbi:MAG: hypothetical protein IJN05_03440 [Ruminococcus sp.]|nr:hypothetical protein [Ruminococcus sp.]
MDVNVIIPEFEIHTTPLEEIFIDTTSITIMLDDINEERYKIFVQPYCAINVVTIDCVSSQKYYNDFCYRNGKFHRHILQIDNSIYLNELLKKMNNGQYINELKHYVLPLQDNLIEFISCDIKLEKI